MVWLVSYPKSGNTWFRIFLSNILYSEKRPVNINSIPINNASYARTTFEELIGLQSDMLTIEEEHCLRADAFQKLASSLSEIEFFKVHESYFFDSYERPVFPESISRSAVYIVRNPLDVAVSFSNHLQVTLDRAIEHMCNPDYDLARNKGNNHSHQLSQPLQCWSGHVNSWLDQDKIPIHLIRYEDMTLKAEQTFSSVIKHLNINASKDIIQLALKKSSFDKLQEMEKKHGFKEHKNSSVTFFWKGKIGNWRNYLSNTQKNKLIKYHARTMEKLGYLNDNGEPTY